MRGQGTALRLISGPEITRSALHAQRLPSAWETAKHSRDALSPIRRVVIAAILLTIVLPVGGLLSLHNVAQSAGVRTSVASDITPASSTQSGPAGDLLNAMSPSSLRSGAPEVGHASSAYNEVPATEKNSPPVEAGMPGGESAFPPHTVQPFPQGSSSNNVFPEVNPLSTVGQGESVNLAPIGPEGGLPELPTTIVPFSSSGTAESEGTLSSLDRSSPPTGTGMASPILLKAAGPGLQGATMGNDTRSVGPLVNQQGMGIGWNGINSGGDYMPAGWGPSDGGIAVGPADVVQVVNLAIGVWTKNGIFVANNSLASMFGTGTDRISDPQILYDSANQRYVLTFLDAAKPGFLIAVSVSSFSSGSMGLSCDGVNWYCWTITGGIYTGQAVDQPKLGVSTNMFTVAASNCTANLLSCSGQGVVYALPIAPMLTGGSFSYQWWGPWSSWGAYLTPVNSLSPTSTQYVVGQLASNLVIANITGTPPTASLNWWAPAIFAYTQPLNAPQPGTSTTINVASWSGEKIVSAVYENGVVWAGSDNGCGSPTMDCVRLDEYSPGTSQVLQDFQFSSGSQWDYYPALTMDSSGDLAVEFSTSDSSVYGSLAIAGQSYGATAGSISGSYWLVQGTTDQLGGRYGDFYEGAQDPLNPYSLWVEGEYAGFSPNTGYWDTWINNVDVGPNGPLSGYISAPSSADAGQSIQLNLSSSNSQCNSSQPNFCNWAISSGDGATLTDSCDGHYDWFNVAHTYGSPGTYTIGSTAYVDQFTSATCAVNTYLDGSLQLATRTISITPALTVPAPTASLPGVDLGQQSVTFTESPSGGAPPYTYVWNNLPGGCTTANSATITCTPNYAGTYSITVTVTDANSNTITSPPLSFTVDAALTVPAPTASLPGVDLGQQSVTFTESPTWGAQPYTYAWNNLPGGCTATNSATITCTPNYAGTYSITVTVTDANSNTITSPPLSFTVDAALTVPAPTASLPVVDAGQQVVTFTVSPSGGANSYSTYAWGGLPAGCATANSATITCTPTTASTNSIKVAVTDANSNTMTSTPLSFAVDPALLVGAPSGPTSGTIGTPVTFTTTGGSGGSGSYTYAWNGLPAGCSSANALTITCTPTGPNGPSIINISATDGNANRVYSAAHTFTLGPVLVVPTPTVSKASIDVNQSTTFTVTPTGGSGTYAAYVWNGLPTGCASVSQATLTCTPTSATGTPFAVSVTVTDSSGNTNTSATVTFTVYRDPTVGTATSNVTSADVGQPVTFASAIPVGGSGGFTYAWSGLPAGCSSTATTVPCTPTVAGTSSVTVTVTDTNGYAVSSAALPFVTYALPTVTTPSSSVSVGTVGQAITFTTTGAGGSGGLTFVWTSTPTGLGCTASTIHIVTCTPTVAGSYSVTVTVNDTNGGKVSATLSSFAVLAASSLPSISSFSASPASIVLGAWTNFTVVASGGTGSLTYSYTGLPTGCASADTAMLACRATSAGTFTVTVTVTDQASHSATKSATLMVTTSSGGPTISSFTATPSTVNVGSPTQLKVSASGGSGTLSYAYTGLPGGCSSQDTASLSCTPNATGTFTIKVFVNDSARHSVTSTTSLTVNSQKGGGGSGGTTFGGLSVTLLLLLVAVIVAVVVIVTVLGRRKKGGTTPAPAAPPMPPPPVQPLAPPPG